MKKIVALFIMIASLFLVACTESRPVNITKSIPYASSSLHVAVEMPSQVLLVQTGALYYFSRVDGKSYPFCFNSLCQHTVQEKCPSGLFGHELATLSQVAYSENKNRVYMARGQKIYSMSCDASDLRLECSLGGDGDVEVEQYNTNFIRNLRCYENYIYFMYTNDRTGHSHVLRYDTDRKKLKEMTSGEREWALAYELADGYVYFKMINADNVIKYYTANMNFKNKKRVADPVNPKSLGMNMDVYDGNFFYGRGSDGLYAFNPLTGEKNLISNDETIIYSAMITAVTQDGVYYFVHENYSENEKYGSKYRNSICCVSFDGSIKKVCSVPTGDMSGLNFIDNGVIVNLFSVYSLDETGENVSMSRSNLFIHFDISEDGKFVNPKPIGNHEGDEELINFFENMD